MAAVFGNPYTAIGVIFLISLALFVLDSFFAQGPVSVMIRVAMLLLAPLSVAVVCIWAP